LSTEQNEAIKPRRILLVAGPIADIGPAFPAYEIRAFPDILDEDPYAVFQGREVDIWPANSAAGYADADEVAVDILSQPKPPKLVRIVKLAGKDYGVGWTLRDAIKAGWDSQKLIGYARRDNGQWLVTQSLPEKGPRGTQVEQSKPKPMEDPGSIFEKWQVAGLSVAGNGIPHPNIDNAVKAMEYAKIPIWFDPFLVKIIYAVEGEEREFGDAELAALTRWFQGEFGVRNMGKLAVNDAVHIYARTHQRNCCRDWLESLRWDLTPRLNLLMPMGLGTDDTEYYQAIGRCFLMGMVLRVLRPGAEVKAMPVLEGPENARKTRALQTIGGKFYAAANDKILDKDFLQLFPGKMLIDISEMHSFSKAEVGRIKSIISTPSDRYRESYGRYAADHPRQCVFAGTTNRDDWNTSDTGATRFWPVACGQIDTAWIEREREQLFAEAVARIQDGECHWDVPEGDARDLVDERRARDPWEEQVMLWCDARPWVLIEDILTTCVGLELKKCSPMEANRIRSILRANGYRRVSIREGHKIFKAYKKMSSYALSQIVQQQQIMPQMQHTDANESQQDDDGIPF
jgi:predicted P-loop ATPase